MDSNNWRAAQGQVQIPGQVIGGEAVAAAGMEGGDWRTQLQPDSRERIVNKIMETLKRNLPFSGQEGLQKLKEIAVRFEEKIYTAATSQSDYLRKVSLKMLTMETRSQNPMANSLQSNAASNSRNPQDPGQMSAMVLTPDNMIDNSWFPDSGATNHVTNELANLNVASEYDGGNRLHVGNGAGPSNSSYSSQRSS